MRALVRWGVFVLVVLGVGIAARPAQYGGRLGMVTVAGTSMEPTYHDGDLVLSLRRSRYEVGDVIVYDAPIGIPFNVIHRVVDHGDGGYVTRGDNRDRADGWLAPDDEVYGAAWALVPRGGVVLRWLRQPSVLFALLAGTIAFQVMQWFDRAPRVVAAPMGTAALWTSKGPVRP